jgi:hypothetical protein
MSENDFYIVSMDENGDSGLHGVFASEAIARFASKYIMNPKLCQIEWLDEEVE